MGLSTMGDLQTAVANWLERDDLGNRIPEFILLAEQRIYNTLRVREMESLVSITASTSVSVLSLSASILQIRNIRGETTTGPSLEFRSPIAFDRVYDHLPAAANPQYFTIEGEQLRIAPVTTANVILRIRCYKKLVGLSAAADTNSLLTRAGGLYLYGALLEATPFLGDDPRLAVWASMWNQIKDAVQESDALGRYSGDVRPRVSDVHVAAVKR